MITKEHEKRPVNELQSLLDYYIFNRDHFAETYSERSDLNKTIIKIRRELELRKHDSA